jgi:hypothetical protein
MNIYNLVLAFILMLVNWLFFSTYFNIYTVFKKVDHFINSKKNISINLISLILYFFIYLLASLFFEFNSIKSFDIIVYSFLQIFIFTLLIFFSIYFYFIEKLKIYHIIILVLFSVIIISFIYPLLLNIVFDKYE